MTFKKFLDRKPDLPIPLKKYEFKELNENHIATHVDTEVVHDTIVPTSDRFKSLLSILKRNDKTLYNRIVNFD